MGQNGPSARDPGDWVQGKVVCHAVDVNALRLGDAIAPPYEVTLSAAWADLWFSAFHANDRVNVSTPFARRLGLQDAVMPFHLVLLLAGSMTHADAADVQLGYRDAAYHWPLFARDTVTRAFTLKAKRDTQDGRNAIFTFACVLRNQRGKICFTADKTMMFLNRSSATAYKSAYGRRQGEAAAGFHGGGGGGGSGTGMGMPSVGTCGGGYGSGRGRSTSSRSSGGGGGAGAVAYMDGWAPHALHQHIAESAERMAAAESPSLTALRPGMLLLHSTSRPLSATQCMQLASLARLTHPRHFDHHVFGKKGKDGLLLIPGALVAAATASAANRDLHEVLHEELLECRLINTVQPGDTVGAVSYVVGVEENVRGDLEQVTLRTLGAKNLHVAQKLRNVQLPGELFRFPRYPHDHGGTSGGGGGGEGGGEEEAGWGRLTRKYIEGLCREKCPVLSGHIVSVLDRRILRQKPTNTQPFLL